MMTFTELAPATSDPPEPFTDRLRLAVAAYLACFKGSSREHTESDLRCYLAWCAERGLDPAAQRPHLELYVRSMQEIRRFKLSTVLPPVLSRGRVLPDLRRRRNHGALTRRARPPSGSPRRITHPRVHPPAVRGPAHRRPGIAQPVRSRAGGHARPAGPADLRSPGTDIADLGEEHGHRVLRVCGKGTKVVLVPLPPAAGRAIDQSIGSRTRGPILLNSRGARMDRHAAPAACTSSPRPPASGSPGRILI